MRKESVNDCCVVTMKNCSKTLLAIKYILSNTINAGFRHINVLTTLLQKGGALKAAGCLLYTSPSPRD